MMVSFRGGSSSATTSSSQDGSIETSVDNIAHSLNGVGIRDQKELESSSGDAGMSFAVSDDGGMMFSTS
jgi:hypothetical protein